MEYKNLFVSSNHYLNVKCGTENKTWTPLRHQVLAQDALGANENNIISQRDDVIQVSMNPDYDKSIGGFLVLPTGAGKTSTTVNWLVNDVLIKNEDYKVLWIAHQNLLLEQAAESFYKHISQANSNKNLSVRVVSGDHDSIDNISTSDNIIIISRQILSGNIDLLLNKYQHNQKLYLIIDEAHHASANTYVKIINEMITERFLIKLIGLTATPTRAKESEIYDLRKVFSIGDLENINSQGTKLPLIYNQDIQILFKEKILALPNLMTEKISSNLSLAMKFTKKQWSELARRHNFTIDQMEEVKGIISERSKLILDLYMKNRDKFGKTLIFAWNQDNAKELTEVFRSAGVKADYVISDRNDNQEVIDKFKNNNLDVLINVNILSEGSDVPNIKTVFLTRYTKSRILMTQMIGRALRGTKVGGTETANIISFVDEKLFSKLKDLINPEDIIKEMLAPPEARARNTTSQELNDEERELKRILGILEKLLFGGNGQYEDSYLSKISIERRYPIGFYDVSFGDGNYPLMVFDNQKIGYKSIEEQLKIYEEYLLGSKRGIIINSEISEALVELTNSIVSYLYEVMEPPYIDNVDIEKFMKHFIEMKRLPRFIPITEINEDSFAGTFRNIDNEVDTLLRSNQSEDSIIKAIISNFDSYIDGLVSEGKKEEVIKKIKLEVQNSIKRNSKNQDDIIKELTVYNPIRVTRFNEIENNYKYAIVLYVSELSEGIDMFFNRITNQIKKDNSIDTKKYSFLIFDISSEYADRQSEFYRKREGGLPNIIIFNEFDTVIEVIELYNKNFEASDFQQEVTNKILSHN